jgi:hypothetical protein
MTKMDVPEFLETISDGLQFQGSYDFSELLSIATARRLNALAAAQDKNRRYYLAFHNGEPEGAIYQDPDGVLYGDNAVVHIRSGRGYGICEVREDRIGTLVMGCRIFEKSHIGKDISRTLPEIGKRPEGIGVVTIQVRKGNQPQNGVRVSLRKDGKIVGSDITTGNGEAGFRVMYGDYTCIIQDRSPSVTQFPVEFTQTTSSHTLDL